MTKNKRSKNRPNNDKVMDFTLARRHEIIILAILFLVAFIIRMLTYNSIFVGDNIRFLEFDTFYHMRRAISFANNFPHIWNFDTYIDYPYGSNVGWPPFYDWTIALIANIIGLSHPSKHLIETVGVYFPVLIGSLSVVVIYFVAKEIFSDQDKNCKDWKKCKDWKNCKSWQIGFISGLLFAIIPAFVQVSFLGFVDHHVAEVLLSSMTYLFFLRTLKSESFKDRLTFSSVTIFVLILAIFTWPGTPIFIGIILIYAIVQSIIDKRYIYLFTIIGTISIFYIGTYFLFPTIYNNLSSGIGFLTREGPVMQQIQEAQPLFFTFNGKFTLEPSWYAFNTALYIAAIGIILYIFNMTKHGLLKGLLKDRVFFLTWTLIVLILNLYQTRFIYLFAVNVVILCAYLITELINSNKVYVKMIGTILLITILIPSIQTDYTMAEHPLMLSDDWFTSLEWLSHNTPNPNGNWDMPSKDQIPNYGIMAWWDYGNYVLYLSQRPVIANNFQLGIEDSANFFTSENESEANNIMNKRKAKYVIVDYRLGLNVFKVNDKTYIRGSWVSMALILGKGMSYYLDRNNLPNEKYFNTMYAQLYLFDGKKLNNYKLIYKSQTQYPDIFNRPIEEIKIFQYTG